MTPQTISLSAAGSSAWIPVDYKQNPYYINLALVFSDTPSLTCKVEYTLDNVFDSSVTPTAFTHTSLSSVSTNTTGSITYPVRAIRLTISSWTSGTVTLTALQGVTNPQIYTSFSSGSAIYKFPDWPSNGGFLLASLVNGATASRTANVVTVAATAHTVPSGVSYVGYRFYYAGSSSLAAGWYDSILTIPDVNTITFSAPGPDFASESINGGTAWILGTDLITMTLAGNTLKDQSKLSIRALRSSSLSAITKNLSITIGGTTITSHGISTSPRIEGSLSFRCLGSNQQVGVGNGVEGIPANTANFITYKDLTQAQTIALRGSVATAPDYIAVMGAHVEIA